MTKDEIFSKPISEIKDFSFDSNVARVFDDMINRSVPLYDHVQTASARIAAKFAKPNSTIYDLGCSTGTTLIKTSAEISDPSITLTGVDVSEPMLAECRTKLARLGLNHRVSVCNESVTTFAPKNASFVFLNYTLQFIEPTLRKGVLRLIFDNLLEGGALLLTEKVVHDDSLIEELITDLYYAFKRDNGYSQLEISQKREALEKVLQPLSVQENISLLKTVGFTSVDVFLKVYPFTTFLAIKKAT